MRQHSYPGLQAKFQYLIRESFVGVDSFSSQQVLEKVRELGTQHQMSQEEKDFICRGIGNFLTAAKNVGVIKSFGRRRGYALLDDEGCADLSQASEAFEENGRVTGGAEVATDCAEANPSTEKTSIMSESFLHFPATLLLAEMFQSRVVSLPSKLDGRKWANPDMIMIHDNRLPRAEAAGAREAQWKWEEQLKLLSKVDNSPEFIITSVELKLSLRNRTDVLNALSETALNGGWANQNILVALDENNDLELSLDEDAREFARRNGIGLYTITVDSSIDDSRPQLQLNQILPPQVRSTLESKNLSKLSPALYQKVLKLIEDYSEDGPLIGHTDRSDSCTLTQVLLQAINNLEIQRDFKERKDLEARLQAAIAANQDGSKLIDAIGAFLPKVVEDVEIDKKDIYAELQGLPKRDSDRVESMYEILTEQSRRQGGQHSDSEGEQRPVSS